MPFQFVDEQEQQGRFKFVDEAPPDPRIFGGGGLRPVSPDNAQGSGYFPSPSIKENALHQLKSGLDTVKSIPGGVSNLWEQAKRREKSYAPPSGFGYNDVTDRITGFGRGVVDIAKEYHEDYKPQSLIESFKEKPLTTPIKIGLDAWAIATGGGALGRAGMKKALGETAVLKSELAVLETKYAKDVGTKFVRSVKPGQKYGGKTPKAGGKADKQVLDGNVFIVENSDKIKYVDDIGNPFSGKTPQTMAQYAQAEQQGLDLAYNMFNDVAKTASDLGGKVKLDSFKKTLSGYTDDISAAFDPKSAGRARSKLAKLEDVDELSIMDAQKQLRRMNDNFTTLSSAEHEARMALLKATEKAIGGLAGPEWAEVRRVYGALRSTSEKVWNKAKAMVQKGEASGGLSGKVGTGTMIHAAITGNPHLLLTGAAFKSISKYKKWKKDADKIVRDMFTETQKYIRERDKITGKIALETSTPVSEWSSQGVPVTREALGSEFIPDTRLTPKTLPYSTTTNKASPLTQGQAGIGESLPRPPATTRTGSPVPQSHKVGAWDESHGAKAAKVKKWTREEVEVEDMLDQIWRPRKKEYSNIPDNVVRNRRTQFKTKEDMDDWWDSLQPVVREAEERAIMRQGRSSKDILEELLKRRR